MARPLFMFLKSYTGLSSPKLMEQLNANIHYQIFCGIRISSANPQTNYKLIDDIILELSNRLRIQNQQQDRMGTMLWPSTMHWAEMQPSPLTAMWISPPIFLY